MRLLLLATIAALCMAGGSLRLEAQGCGIKPIAPIPPIGCKRMAAECVCDSSGQHCGWQWVCVN